MLTQPVPFKAASDLIAGMPAVHRSVFDNLPDDLKPWAFTITGVERANVLQSVRDKIAELPLGGDWDDLKSDIADTLTPFLGDNKIAADRRAELLLRLHGGMAHARTQHEVMERQKDLFPYRQYLTDKGPNVRPSHAALDGIVLPADSPFWAKHTPPWEFGCHCTLVPLSEDDYNDIQKRDKNRIPENKQILEGPARERLEQQGRISRGPSGDFDVRTPSQKGKTGGFEWDPNIGRPTWAGLKDRYDPVVQTIFQNFLESVILDAITGRSLFDWLLGGKS